MCHTIPLLACVGCDAMRARQPSLHAAVLCRIAQKQKRRTSSARVRCIRHARSSLGSRLASVRRIRCVACQDASYGKQGLMLCTKPLTGGLQSWSTMGRSETSGVAKVFVLASRGMDLHKAWEKCGSPTTWGNAQRRFKAAQPAAPAAPAAATAASRPAAGSSRARRLLAVAGGAMHTPAKKPRSCRRAVPARQPRARCALVRNVHIQCLVFCNIYVWTVGG